MAEPLHIWLKESLEIRYFKVFEKTVKVMGQSKAYYNLL